MSSPDPLGAPGWLTQFRRGVVSGFMTLLVAVGACAVATVAAWLVPGTDTTAAVSALKAAVLVALAGAHGGIVLAGTPVSLTPLLVTVLLGWLVAGHARRLDSSLGFAGFVTGYGVGSAVLAGWSRLGTTTAPVLRSTIAALIFVLVIGGGARCAGRLSSGLSHRWRCVIRAAGVVIAGYLLAGSLLAAGTLLWHMSDAVALQHQLAPGVAGLPVALLGISATPNAVLAAVGYLTGPGFQVGTHTSVSAFDVHSGRLPVFPLLAGVPHGRPATALGLALILGLALLAGWAVVRTVAAQSWSRRLLDCAAAAVLAAGALAVLARLGSGDLGSGALRGVGATWWAVGSGTALLVLCGAALWLGAEVLDAGVLRGTEVPDAGVLGDEAAGDQQPRPARTGLYALKSEPADAAAEDDTEPADPDQRPGAEPVAEPAARSRNAS